MNSLEGLAAALAGDEGRKLAVWAKGYVIPGYDSAVWRYDSYGNVLRYSDHGDRESKFGWEIDHIHPVGLLGGDQLDNLRPLHCSQNASLGGLLGAALKG